MSPLTAANVVAYTVLTTAGVGMGLLIYIVYALNRIENDLADQDDDEEDYL